MHNLNISNSLLLKKHKVSLRDYGEVVDALKWIEMNLTEDIDLKDLTNHAGYGHWYFQKKFKGITGVSLWSYIKKGG